MAEVNVSIHGKPYGISCDDGQEERVLEVGRYVDARARDISTAGAASNENHLLVLTALVLADEIKELNDNITQLTAQVTALNNGEPIELGDDLSAEKEEEIMQAIEYLQGRLNTVATRLQNL